MTDAPFTPGDVVILNGHALPRMCVSFLQQRDLPSEWWNVTVHWFDEQGVLHDGQFDARQLRDPYALTRDEFDIAMMKLKLAMEPT